MQIKGRIIDKANIAGLVMMLHYLDIYTLYSEDVDIIADIHEFGPVWKAANEE